MPATSVPLRRALVALLGGATILLNSCGGDPTSSPFGQPANLTGAITLTPTSRVFNVARNGPSPAVKTIAVASTGTQITALNGGTITYTGGATGWLTRSFTPTSTPSTLKVGVVPGAIAVGTYKATFPVLGTGATNSPTVTVTMNVSDSPWLVSDVNLKSFTVNQGAAPPAAKKFNLTNGGTAGTTITDLSVQSITYNAGQPTGWLTTATLNTPTAPARLTVRPTPGSLTPGTYNATVKVVSAQALNGLVNLKVRLVVNPVVTSQYAVEVQYLSAMTPTQQAAFDNAAARWHGVITGDQTDVFVNLAAAQCTANQPALNRAIDDVLIMAEVTPIDGVGGILGSAGPCLIRGSNKLTVLGTMRFDVADIQNMENNGTLGDVILHEMGHVLGIGTLWSANFLNLIVPTATDPNHPYFFGANAVAKFNTIGGLNFPFNKVPIENCCGAGTQNSHWRETNSFGNELMTGFIAGPGNPLSVVTIGSLQDEGYVVNYAAADPYTFTGTTIRAPGLGSVITVTRLNEEILQPKFTVGANGAMLRIAPRQ